MCVRMWLGCICFLSFCLICSSCLPPVQFQLAQRNLESHFLFKKKPFSSTLSPFFSQGTRTSLFSAFPKINLLLQHELYSHAASLWRLMCFVPMPCYGVDDLSKVLVNVIYSIWYQPKRSSSLSSSSTLLWLYYELTRWTCLLACLLAS